MSFLYPQFLWALTALAIPLLIHLFQFQRPRQVRFTNVRFLRTVQSATRAQRRLKHLLVLLARMAFLALLVMAFAQPIARTDEAAATTATPIVSFYFDNSYSMQQARDERPALDRAAVLMGQLVEAYPENARFQLLTNAFAGQEQYFADPARTRDALTSVGYASTYRDAAAIYRRQQRAFEAAGETGGALFWFSDFQRNTLGDLTALEPDSQFTLHLVPLQAPEVSNVYVDSVWLSEPFLRVGQNNQLEARVAHAGTTAPENLTFKLFLDDVQVSTASVRLEPNARETVLFTFAVNEAGAKRGRITVEDYPIAFDNTYYFVIPETRRINVAHIWQEAQPFVPNVFRNEALFNLRSTSFRTVDYEFLKSADLIVFDGLVAPDAALSQSVAERVRSGGSLVVFPAASPSLADYNALLGQTGGPALRSVATTTTDTAGAARTGNRLSVPDADDPFFEGVFERTTDRNVQMPFARATVSWSGGTPLLRFRSGQPFLSEFRRTGGRTYVAAAPLQTTLTDFPRHSLFVPVMYRLAMRAANNTEPLAYSFQEPIVSFEVAPSEREEVYRLQYEALELIPEQRRTGRQLVLELPRTELAAGYYVVSDGERALRTVALNYGAAESQMDFYTAAELTEIFAAYPHVRVSDAQDEAAFVSDFRAQTLGTPLWKYALGLALFFLLVEILLLRFLR